MPWLQLQGSSNALIGPRRPWSQTTSRRWSRTCGGQPAAGPSAVRGGGPSAPCLLPHDTVVSLVAVLKDGRSAEMAVYGREGALGLVSAVTAVQSFGRYIVQATGLPPGSSWSACTR
jgi:hypothetical protein